MKKCLIIYFSQQGATKKVAESIASGLEKKGFSLEFHNLARGPVAQTRSFDMIGLGFPVYYSYPPFSIMRFVRELAGLDGKPFFTFTLHGNYRGDASTIVRKELVKKGGLDLGYFHCFGENRFYGYLKEGYLFSPGRPHGEDLDRAALFGGELARRYGEGAVNAGDYDRPAPLMYRIERFVLNEWLVRNLYSRLFRVKKNLCTACDTCIGVCPTNNIGRDERGRLVRGRDCIMCLACQSACPGGAVRSPLTWTVNRPIFWYNIADARRDPAISHERIRHEKGRILPR